jgi:hypothetical protein
VARRKTHSKPPKRSAKAAPAPAIGGLRGLAVALREHGVTRSHAALARIVKDPRWHAGGFSDRAPWPTKQLPAMARLIGSAFQEDRSRADAGDEDEAPAKDLVKATAVAKLGVLVERKATLKVNREIKLAQFVAREEAEAAAAVKWRAVKAALQQIPKALRQLLADTSDPGRIEDILATALRRICDDAFEGGHATGG